MEKGSFKTLLVFTDRDKSHQDFPRLGQSQYRSQGLLDNTTEARTTVGFLGADVANVSIGLLIIASTLDTLHNCRLSDKVVHVTNAALIH